jgi:N-glycosylase/DNA lyase
VPQPALKLNETTFAAPDYDLAATLGCGQAFRWEMRNNRWRGVVGSCSLELWQQGGTIFVRSAAPQTNWAWLANYLQVDANLAAILDTFPKDTPMQQAVAACRGLRLLRQEPWECLASFILSSTKQIVQIRQIIARLCERYGNPVAGTAGKAAAFAFPTPAQIAGLTDAQLRDCKMGFRASYLLRAAQIIQANEVNLDGLSRLDLPEARARLLGFPGVGPKIADCVLLFAYGFPTAFPVDVWVMKALRQSYFRNRRVPLAKLRDFSATHFGPNAGYAQQYLFHSLRRSEGKKLSH